MEVGQAKHDGKRCSNRVPAGQLLLQQNACYWFLAVHKDGCIKN